jgi:hypothetical protein
MREGWLAAQMMRALLLVSGALLPVAAFGGWWLAFGLLLLGYVGVARVLTRREESGRC